MNKTIEQLAIIGSTASGKTSLAVKVAEKRGAYILSLDSLSIYKEINIVSAKPTPSERRGIPHFGIDVISPNEAFDVTTFITLYKEALQECKKDHKALVIVGGTGFYLKMLLEGVSDVPKISDATKKETVQRLLNLKEAYNELYHLDPDYMCAIKSGDHYRIEKAWHIYLESGQTPTEYFKAHPPLPAIEGEIDLYQIKWPRDRLRERIALRTEMMVKDGLIDEICDLEKTYGRAPHCMKAIGIKETLAYLDGEYDKETMIKKITTHTSQLAKRQNTFNNSQFKHVTKGSIETLEKLLV